MVRLAKCCRPVPGDEIVGYVSLGRGITIHREDCKNVAALTKAPERFTEVSWAGDNSTSYRVELQVDAWDRTRLLEDLSRTFSEARHQHPRGQVLDQAPDGQEPLRGRGRRHRAAQAVRSPGCATSSRSSTPTGSRRPSDAGERPPVSVVVPFGGGARAPAAGRALERIAAGAGDELIVADNSRRRRRARSAAVARVVAGDGRALVLPRPQRRRRAARRRVDPVHGRRLHARRRDLLDAYFARGPSATAWAPSPGRSWRGPGQRALAARYARDRKVLSQTDGLYGRGRTIARNGEPAGSPRGVRALGGFVEGIRSAGDVDFCRRLQDAGLDARVPPERRSVAPPPPGERGRRCCAPSPATARASRWLDERYPGLSRRAGRCRRSSLLAWGADAARHDDRRRSRARRPFA